MGRAIVTSIRIDEDVLRRAKEVGLNISKVSENALKEAIARLEGPVRGGARK
jgi:post-segregation antitoxin (ccd killing protein)